MPQDSELVHISAAATAVAGPRVGVYVAAHFEASFDDVLVAGSATACRI